MPQAAIYFNAENYITKLFFLPVIWNIEVIHQVVILKVKILLFISFFSVLIVRVINTIPKYFVNSSV